MLLESFFFFAFPSLYPAGAIIRDFISAIRHSEKQILLPQGGIRMTCPAAAGSG
jgi:hypothetical protein